VCVRATALPPHPPTRITPASASNVARAPIGRTSFCSDVAERQAGEDGDGQPTKPIPEYFFQAEAPSFNPAVAAAAEEDAGDVVEQAAEGERGAHAVDAVALFVDVLQEEDGVGGVGLVGGAHQGGDHGQVAAHRAGSCWS